MRCASFSHGPAGCAASGRKRKRCAPKLHFRPLYGAGKFSRDPGSFHAFRKHLSSCGNAVHGPAIWRTGHPDRSAFPGDPSGGKKKKRREGRKMHEFETVVGLEVHVELKTRSKIFCSCPTAFGGDPNAHICEVCAGLPGALPRLNKKVVEYAVRTALALNCEITEKTRFDRKNYFYPDLPKGYQISQLYAPVGRNGSMKIDPSSEKVIRIHELHMEDDAGKLIHDGERNLTRIDFSRCGVPLLEIVTEPDFRTADEVTAFLTTLRTMLKAIGVSMEKRRISLEKTAIGCFGFRKLK